MASPEGLASRRFAENPEVKDEKIQEWVEGVLHKEGKPLTRAEKITKLRGVIKELEEEFKPKPGHLREDGEKHEVIEKKILKAEDYVVKYETNRERKLEKMDSERELLKAAKKRLGMENVAKPAAEAKIETAVPTADIGSAVETASAPVAESSTAETPTTEIEEPVLPAHDSPPLPESSEKQKPVESEVKTKVDKKKIDQGGPLGVGFNPILEEISGGKPSKKPEHAYSEGNEEAEKEPIKAPGIVVPIAALHKKERKVQKKSPTSEKAGKNKKKLRNATIAGLAGALGFFGFTGDGGHEHLKLSHRAPEKPARTLSIGEKADGVNINDADRLLGHFALKLQQDYPNLETAPPAVQTLFKLLRTEAGKKLILGSNEDVVAIDLKAERNTGSIVMHKGDSLRFDEHSGEIVLERAGHNALRHVLIDKAGHEHALDMREWNVKKVNQHKHEAARHTLSVDAIPPPSITVPKDVTLNKEQAQKGAEANRAFAQARQHNEEARAASAALAAEHKELVELIKMHPDKLTSEISEKLENYKTRLRAHSEYAAGITAPTTNEKASEPKAEAKTETAPQAPPPVDRRTDALRRFRPEAPAASVPESNTDRNEVKVQVNPAEFHIYENAEGKAVAFGGEIDELYKRASAYAAAHNAVVLFDSPYRDKEGKTIHQIAAFVPNGTKTPSFDPNWNAHEAAAMKIPTAENNDFTKLVS